MHQNCQRITKYHVKCNISYMRKNIKETCLNSKYSLGSSTEKREIKDSQSYDYKCKRLSTKVIIRL